jgi:hypothetical protein
MAPGIEPDADVFRAKRRDLAGNGPKAGASAPFAWLGRATLSNPSSGLKAEIHYETGSDGPVAMQLHVCRRCMSVSPR